MDRFDMPPHGFDFPTFPENWGSMSGNEKFDYYSSIWRGLGDEWFKSPKEGELYRQRVQRVLDVLALKEPDRVPVHLMTMGYILGYEGLQPKDAFYNHEKIISATLKFHEEFKLAYSVLPGLYSGTMLDTLGSTIIKWPGSSLPDRSVPDGISYQYVEDEYMREDEYDELINQPEGYVLRKYLPRVCPALEGFRGLPNIFNLVELTGFAGLMSALGKGTPSRNALETLLKAVDQAEDIARWTQSMPRALANRLGVFTLIGGITFAPFDLIGDTMRCTMGIMKDLYRRPEKVMAAVEALVPMAVQIGVQAAEATRNPIIFMPLHKGSDIFLSQEQFESFYWPTLRATMQGLIDAGCIPMPFLEGAYNYRLDTIASNPLPKGKSIWIFSQADMQEVNAKFGSWACIAGNVSASLFKQGSPEMLDAYCRDLIDTCAPGGGFFLFPGAIIDQANPENIRAFLNCGRKYGRY